MSDSKPTTSSIRVRDEFSTGDSVEICFSESSGWIAGRVIDHEHPGIWVRTDDGGKWFVTNNRHIRKAD